LVHDVFLRQVRADYDFERGFSGPPVSTAPGVVERLEVSPDLFVGVHGTKGKILENRKHGYMAL
jgi:hypothetical protein